MKQKVKASFQWGKMSFFCCCCDIIVKEEKNGSVPSFRSFLRWLSQRATIQREGEHVRNMNRKVSEQPVNEYNSVAAREVLEVADTYLKQADHLIYSYGSKTFLSGYDLYDSEYGGKGNIDCSTFILLVLAGIRYEDSPYSAGTVKNLKLHPFLKMDFTCFEEIPDRYITIAERIGIPEIAGPKGLDMEKAESLGITGEELMAKIKSTGIKRRSVELARFFYDRGELFLNPEYLKPGDIVFYQSSNFFAEASKREMDPLEVTHVGIVSENIQYMFNSSGYYSKERAMEKQLPAVSLSQIFGKRIPVFFARPDYCR